MSIDPRLDSLMDYAISELGAGPSDPTARLGEAVTNLQRRVEGRERAGAHVNVGTVVGTPPMFIGGGAIPVRGIAASAVSAMGENVGPPTSITPGRNGVLIWDNTGRKLWASSSGGWLATPAFT